MQTTIASTIESPPAPNVLPFAAALPWFSLKIRTRSEPVAIAALESKGYELFAPTQKERRIYSDRVKVVRSAVFPGYLFCRFDPQKKVPVLSSAAVEYVVGCAGVPTVIPDSEIDAIRRAVNAGAVPADYFRVGRRVRVLYGPLAGIEGTLLRLNYQDMLVVSISLLQRSVAVQIESRMVEALPS